MTTGAIFFRGGVGDGSFLGGELFPLEINYPALTVCPRSSDTLYVVAYYIKWVTSSWTHGI